MSQIVFIRGEQIDLVVKNIEHIDKYLKWEKDPTIRRYRSAPHRWSEQHAVPARAAEERRKTS